MYYDEQLTWEIFLDKDPECGIENLLRSGSGAAFFVPEPALISVKFRVYIS